MLLSLTACAQIIPQATISNADLTHLGHEYYSMPDVAIGQITKIHYAVFDDEHELSNYCAKRMKLDNEKLTILACADRNLNTHICTINIHKNAPGWVIQHEFIHCAGFMHK